MFKKIAYLFIAGVRQEKKPLEQRISRQSAGFTVFFTHNEDNTAYICVRDDANADRIHLENPVRYQKDSTLKKKRFI